VLLRGPAVCMSAVTRRSFFRAADHDDVTAGPLPTNPSGGRGGYYGCGWLMFDTNIMARASRAPPRERHVRHLSRARHLLGGDRTSRLPAYKVATPPQSHRCFCRLFRSKQDKIMRSIAGETETCRSFPLLAAPGYRTELALYGL